MKFFHRFADKRRFQRHRAVLWAELRLGRIAVRGKLVDLSRCGFRFRPWKQDFVPVRDAVLEVGGLSLRCTLVHRSPYGLHGSFAMLLTQAALEELLKPPEQRAPDDPYDLLGVPRGAPPEVIKAAYRRQVKNIHPDLQAAHADRATLLRLNDRMARLNAAYQAIKGA